MYRQLIKPLLVFLLCCLPVLVIAEIFKHVDANGNVTYSDVPPVDGQSKSVESIQAEDASVNVFKSQVDESEASEAFKTRRENARQEASARAKSLAAWNKELKAAKRELSAAKKALSVGVIATEGDFVGGSNGGARPSASYYKKFEALEARVADAEKQLALVKRARPK